jgi:hypothetical protein
LNKIRVFSALFFACLALPPVRALDFGLVINQAGEYTNTSSLSTGNSSGQEETANYTGTYSPWISGEAADGALKFSASAKLTTAYENKEWKYEPLLFEMGSSGLSWRSSPTLFLEAGRLRFMEPSGFVAAGLFDGLSGNFTAGGVRFSLGALYTGLLYKETAKIMMTAGDAERYALPLDYADGDSYFASRRILLSGGAEFPALTRKITLNLNGLAQFDVNGKSAIGGGDSSLHSQYLTVKPGFRPVESLYMSGTMVAALAENQAGDIRAHFAAAAGTDWETPGALPDMVQAEIRWSSGKVNDTVGAFTPLTTISQGEVFTPGLPGLMTIRGKYTVRPGDGLSVSAGGTYFFRTDGETLTGADYPSSSARALGGELYGLLIWSPLPDVILTAGGGAFFPQWGDVFEPEAPVRWKVRTALMLSL